MGWAVAGPIISAAVTGGAGVAASRTQSSANRRAADTQARADAEALQFAKEQEANRRAEFDKTLAAEEARYRADQEQNRLLFEEDQRRYADEQAYRQPYREASHGALVTLGDLIGVKVPAYQRPRDPYATVGELMPSPRQPMNSTLPVYSGGGGATFSSMIPRVQPVDPQRYATMRQLQGY